MTGPVERIHAKVKLKDSEKEKLALTEEIHRVNQEMEEYHGTSQPAIDAYTPFMEGGDELQEEVPSSSPVLRLTTDELAKIIAAANGSYIPSEREPLPPDATLGEKVMDFTDDALGEVGRGAHRVADGCRDIVGGLIDIVTLGRAHRR